MFDKLYIDRMFSIMPTIKSLLCELDDPQKAWYSLLSHIDELTKVLYHDKSKDKSLEWELRISCLSVFKRISILEDWRSVSPILFVITDCGSTGYDFCEEAFPCNSKGVSDVSQTATDEDFYRYFTLYCILHTLHISSVLVNKCFYCKNC